MVNVPGRSGSGGSDASMCGRPGRCGNGGMFSATCTFSTSRNASGPARDSAIAHAGLSNSSARSAGTRVDGGQ